MQNLSPHIQALPKRSGHVDLAESSKMNRYVLYKKDAHLLLNQL